MSEGLALRPVSLAWTGLETAAAGLVLGYGALANRVIPEAFYVPANLVAAGAAIYLAGHASPLLTPR